VAKKHDEISPEIAAWIQRQHLFFVATAPLGADGHVNCSPKGLDTLRLIGSKQVAYLDLTGSGAETIAHVRENGRIVFMFCAFSGAPKIVRLHGKAEVVTDDSLKWTELCRLFPEHLGTRAIILAEVRRIDESCGYGVPKFDFVGDRDSLQQWSDKKGSQGLAAYRSRKNVHSIDGLPSFMPPACGDGTSRSAR